MDIKRQYDSDLWRESGVFIPLEDYFAEYCPRITEILDLPGVREEMTAPDGHIYAIPYVCDDTKVGYSPYINGRCLKKCGDGHTHNNGRVRSRVKGVQGTGRERERRS